MTLETMFGKYLELHPFAEQFRVELNKQIERVLESNGVSLGVPIESRVKSWESLKAKIERQSLDLKQIEDLHDFVGLRLILLFKRDITQVCDLLAKNFNVISTEDISDRLSETQFGYQSLHYIVKVRAQWLSVPTFQHFGRLSAEIQIRTLAQHIWAAASHKLQYKQEQSVPVPVRRSIHRVSALLETVDLEFERVLSERQSYLSKVDTGSPDSALDVDLLAAILDETLPLANKQDPEQYAELLEGLKYFGLNTASDLRKLISRHRDAILQQEALNLAQRRRSRTYSGTTKERTDRGVYYAHVGLARVALQLEFGETRFDEYRSAFKRADE